MRIFGKKLSKRVVPWLVLILSVISFGAASLGVIATELIIDTTGSFTSPDDKYKCYRITGDASGIAVGWNKGSADTDTNHSIPQTITVSGTPYTVKAIVEGGFRGCDFETVTVPNTVEEIRPEAFAYCLNLQSFTFPTKVTEIAPSTFLDDRALERVNYSNGSGGTTTSNSKITIVGDHAFTNCESLLSFPCPSSLVNIGESAFQKCSKMMSFFFPSKNAASAWTNNITIGRYAFADCTSMTLGYFEENMNEVGEFAFAECEKLTLYYTGDTEPTHSTNPGFDVNWRKRHVATGRTDEKLDYVPIEIESGQITEMPDDYPGLYYTIETANIPFDQATTGTAAGSKTIQNNPGTYAKIFKFETPNRTIPGYYDVASGALTIPNQLKDSNGTNRTVKVLDSNSFAANEDIRSVTFNSGLVQIRNRAFYNCLNISALNFSSCTSLLEVSYEVFQGKTGSVPNTLLTSLRLPKCLKYIGAYSFYDFRAVSEFSFMANDSDSPGDLQTVFIGRYAFANLGYNCTENGDGTGKGTGEVDLYISPRLHENTCGNMKPTNLDGNKRPEETYETWTSPVLPYAFKGANCLRSVQVWNKNVSTGTKPRSSFGMSTFENCKSLLRFVSNKNFCYVGQNCFKGCVAIRELFFYVSSLVSGVDQKYTLWGNNNGSGTFGAPIFGNYSTNAAEQFSYPDAVIYVDKAQSSIHSSNQETGVGRWWNADPSECYRDQFGSTSSASLASLRRTIPTYYGVSCDDTGDVITWTNGVEYLDLTDNSLNTSINDSHNTVAFVKSGNNYIATRCYCVSDQSIVDLTLNTTLNPKIIEIGSGCFGQAAGEPIPGNTVILPTSVTTIGERAFFRHNTGTTNTSGVQFVTYKDNNDTPVSVAGKSGYCVLPNSVTRIEALAFFNNRFAALDIEGDVAFLGTGAFSVMPNASALIDDVSLATNTNSFALQDDGIYYTGSGKETLLSQTANSTGTCAVTSGTAAIAPHALANTAYTKISIPATVSTIYGSAMSHNAALTEIEIPVNSQIRFIGSGYASDYSGLIESSRFDVIQRAGNTGKDNWEKYANYGTSLGAVRKNPNLTTVDFTRMTHIEKIGFGAFEECPKLANLTGGAAYSYFKWNGDKTALVPFDANAREKTTGILDLSGCTSLRSIGQSAFKNCKAIQYIHLPNSDSLYVGCDPDLLPESGIKDDMQGVTESNKKPKVTSPFTGLNNGSAILVGQKADIACENGSRTGDNVKRYPNGAFIDQNTAYFPFSVSEDLLKGSTSTRYWTTLDTGSASDKWFLLCNSKADADAWVGKTSEQKAALITAISA